MRVEKPFHFVTDILGLKTNFRPETFTNHCLCDLVDRLLNVNKMIALISGKANAAADSKKRHSPIIDLKFSFHLFS